MLIPRGQAQVWNTLRASRAMRDTANAQVLGKLHTALAAAERLAEAGHLVLDVRLGAGLPTVVLAASALLAAMADEQRAAYWMSGMDERGTHYRKGQLLGTGDVLVEWTERGH